MFRSKDIWYGVLIGIIVPMITFWAIYYGSFNAIPINELAARPGLTSKVLALSLIGNLVAFMIILKRFDKDTMARGVLLATFLYGVVIGILKLME